ncbi:ester cyclase [Methylovirgula sp. 4M-Z18]|nr:ester cyclase [Methylovirgula sp. 4M-Z18]RFB80535.1 hypothetical protein DYH55_03230 [Methylovirgula sp. 4M-Z18]
MFGLPAIGRRAQFTGNVFYEFLDEPIRNVWSIIDQPAIAAQL